jgi:uncharacterized membrane protein YfcA
MSERRKMQGIDWLIGASSMAVGLFLGLAVGEWVQMEGIARWLTIIYIFIPFAFVFVFIFFLSDVTDWVFFSRVRSSAARREKRRKPLALLFTLPVGLVIGAIGAQFGLSELLL